MTLFFNQDRPTYHGSPNKRDLARSTGKLMRMDNGKRDARNRINRRTHARPGANNPRNSTRPTRSWW
jgi:hypothetical protein